MGGVIKDNRVGGVLIPTRYASQASVSLSIFVVVYFTSQLKKTSVLHNGNVTPALQRVDAEYYGPFSRIIKETR